MEDELTTIVDIGGTVVDVFVWHKVYGKVQGDLGIDSRRRVEQFMEGIRSGKSSPLMNITSGYHYHTVRAADEATLDLVEQALAEKGYLVEEKE
jgi:transcriptional regulator of NAD metabolism